MADYQLLGDTFGYHAGYVAAAANAPQNSSSQPPGPGQPPPGLGLMPGSVGPVGQPSYHSLQTPPGSQPRPGYPPQASDPLSMSHKLHQSYAGYGSTSPASIRSQYSQNYMPPPPHGAMDSYPGLSMGQASHLAASSGHHSLGGSYGPPPPHQAAMMSQYPGQRLHSPSSLHTATTARHPTMPSQYSPYSSSLQNSSSSYHGGSGSSELWSSSGQTPMSSHLQQSPFSNFQSPSQTPGATSNSAQTSTTLNSLHSNNSRTSQFSTGSDYGTSSSSNPYFPNHMSNDPSSSYPASYGAGTAAAGPQSQQPPPPTSSSRSSSSSRSQQQYSNQIGSYNSSSQSATSTQQSNQTTGANQASASASNSTASRFSHYSPYAQNISYDPASQARLSPYTTPPTSSSQTPNSPQYRSTSGGYPQSGSTPGTSQLPVNSPRRATATSPAGSPMPPTSHTPGPPSVGSNSTQSSNQGSSAFSVTNPSSSSHHLPNSVGSTTTGAPSSLQQLEQMVMPHLGSGTNSNTSTTTSKSTNSSSTNSSNFYSSNTSSSPISPSQSQSQSKMFPHYASSPSTPSSQFPYHQYPPAQTPQSSGNWPASSGQLAASNTHSLKSGGPGMMQPLVHSAQHLSSSTTSTNATSKSHSSSTESALVTPPYSYNSSKGSNDLPAENNEYSQSAYNSSSNSHSSSSSSSSSSSIPVSHSIAQSSYLNSSLPPPPTSYDSMSSQQKQQSSLKNETTSMYDHGKSSRSVMDSMSGDQPQISNSYHSMMQQSAYSSQPMPPYPNQSRFEQPPPPHPMQSSQYGISSELSNSSYNATEHDTSMLYDPYNIDNGLGMPPHQTMSEYRESQANLQQSGVPPDYPQNDPYAANFDDYETTSKRKGKGRPKKDNSAPKKERKPRQPRSQATRGRGRGRGSKSLMDHIPLPGMIPHEYSESPVGYGAPPSSLGPTPNISDSMDMYGANNLDMYSNPAAPTLSSTNKMPSTNQMLSSAQSTLNSSVLPQPPVPPNTEIITPYGTKPPGPPPPPPPPPSLAVPMNQNNVTHHLTTPSGSMSRSPIPPPTAAAPPPPPPPQPVPSTQSTYDSVPISDGSSYSNYVNDDSKVPPVSSDQPSGLNSSSTVCDNKDLVSNNNEPTNNKAIVSSPYGESSFLVDSSTIKDNAAASNNNSIKPTESNQLVSPIIPPPTQSTSIDSLDRADVEKAPPPAPLPPSLSSMNFNSPQSVESNRASTTITTIGAPTPSSVQQQLIYSTIHEPSSTFESVNVKEHGSEAATTCDLSDKSQINFDSSYTTTMSNTQPLNSMTNQVDLNNSINSFADEPGMQHSSYTSSTPIPEKPKKKRKSKKTANVVDDVNDVVLMAEENVNVEFKPKIKKKRTKKPKSERLMDDTTIISTDFDEKTQLSTSNFDMSNSFADVDLKSTKRVRSKKKKSSTKIEQKSDLSAIESESLASVDINGESNAELVVEEDKVKKPRVKNRGPKRKLPKLALKLKHNKKRRRGFGSPENSDLEKTPPPSPGPEDESAIHKRRSARNTKRQRYNDDIELDLSDEEYMQKSKTDEQTNSQVMNIQLTEDTMVVEKILSSRMAKRELEVEPGEENNEENKEPVFVDVEEFYVKYKNLSYLHCDWKTEEELEKGDRRINQKVRRYKQKKDVNVFDFLDEEPFNPDYVEVDRILDVNEVEEIVEEEIVVAIEEEETKDDNKVTKDDNEVTEDDIKVAENDIKVTKDDRKTKEEDFIDTAADKDIEKMNVDKFLDGPKIKEEKDDSEIKKEKDFEMEKKDNLKIDKEKEKDDTETKDNEKTIVDFKSTENKAKQIEKKEIIKKTKIVRHYLVKWRGLSYEESTWELEDDIDDRTKIDQFWKFKDPPPKSEWKIKKKPKGNEWCKLEQSPVYKNGNTLREYQLEGVNWLSFCWHNGQNCILADEMGLGKTIQSITFIQEMVRYGIPYPYLVIAPLSTIGNWQREFETWTDLNVVTYHGSSPSRNMLQDYELYYKNERNERIPNIYKFQVMITTFEVILTDCLELSSIKWIACIIDEAHRLKNRNCKLLEGLRMLSIDHRVLLTGTPLQNNVEELYSLLHFLEPSQFTSNENFMAEFGDLKTEAQVDKLKAILKPMMLRRLKEDVEKSLAPKEETIIEVELTNVQKKYYRAILERNFQFLSKGGTYANMPNLMNTVMELRKCCIHPFLINGAEEQILQEFRTQHSDESTLNAIIQASGKLVLIDKLLPRLKENGHRVLIFSQMVRCLDILEDYLCQKRYPYERIDGRVRGNLRQAAIDRFSKPDSDRFVFLLCTRAGGLGINLTAADTVIIFDSDWNPQNDLQAQARCHRIGQKKSVKVYRLICRNTYEREMFDRASLKLGLDKAVLQSINAQKNLTAENQLTKKEIEDLLRKGAYGALMEDDAAGDKFCEEDIDMILQRRTTKIVIESEGKGSTFSKASFATSDNRTDIEIDDPNFWEKWAKKANFDVDELKSRNELIVQEPRRRTQTKRFGADDAVLDISELDTSTDEEEAISSRTRGSRNRVSSKKKRKGRFYDPEHDEDYAQEIGFGWTRSEFFKVEKGLLTFGWGRWDECVILANFKRNLSKIDVEDISRVILLFSLQNYKGDEKVKSFILDLITPPSEKNESSDSNNKIFSENECKSRRSKKNKAIIKPICEELETLDWAKSDKYNPDIQMIDETYRKHLLRHANKILLRVRLLSYIKNEIIGDLHEKVFNCLHVRDIPLPYCQPDGEPPAVWWNEEADKSLIIGVYKHGYDRYNLMRQDPALCFLLRCGPPDGAALLAEMTSEDDIVKMDDDDEPDTPATPATPQLDNKENNKEDKCDKSKEQKDSDRDVKEKDLKETQEQIYLPFPTTSEMNNRLRRLVTCYQRNFKKEEARIAQKARHMQRLERLEKFEAAIRERENKKREQAQKKWSRREESDFYRVVSSFGIEYNKKMDTFDWTRFRMYAKLEKKLDDTLTEYFKAFYAMCKKVVGRRLTEDEDNLPISVDPITEERANRCLARIELLNKVRDDILNHPELDERLKLCQPQLDLPEWWTCGKHDKDLLIGAAKYGLNRLDYNLMNDTELSFIEVVRNFEAQTAAEEKAANEKAGLELEIRTILNNLIDQVTNELENELKDEAVITLKTELDSEGSQDSKIMVKQNIEPNKDDISSKTGEEKSTEVKELLPEIKDIKPLQEMDSFIPSSTQIRPQLKWPRDRVLQIRLENVCLAIEKNEWPTFRSITSVMPHSSNTPSIATADSSPRPSTPCSLSSASQEPTPHPTPDHTPRHETQSPFTGDYFYPPNSNTSGQINNFEDSSKKRRRRRRRFEMDNEKTKLQSLLNTNLDQQHSSTSNILNNNNNNNNMINPNISSSSSHVSAPPNPSTFTSSLFKNTKTTNSLLNNIPSQFLSPLLNNLPFNIRSSLREELLNDEKAASILFGPSFQSSLAAAVANASKASPAKTIPGLESKGGNLQSGPPPAHQSSSRNSLSLGSLDLTSKFKSATSAVLEKSNIPPSRSNLPPYPAHKQTPKNQTEKADVLDLSSVPCKSTAGNNKPSSMSNLLSQTFKKSSFPETQTANSLSTPVGNAKKRGKIGSRIDALALNLQAKKMMEEVKQVDNTSTNKLSQQQPTAHSSTNPTSNLSKNLFNEKDLLAAFTSLSSQQQHDKRQSNAFFDELSKSSLFQSVKNSKNNLSNISQQQQSSTSLSSSTNTNIHGSKKSLVANDVSKAYYNMMESFKLLSKAPPPTTSVQASSDKSSINEKSNLMKQNLKNILEENPELLSQSSAFLSIFNNPLFTQSLSQSSNPLPSTSTNVPPPPPPPISNTDEKIKNTRSSKRTRSQYESQQSSSGNNSGNDELLSKRPLLNVSSMSSLMDPKKYLSSLLEKNNADIDAKIKNMIKEKNAAQTPFKAPSVSPSSTSSIRTRTSDKRSSQAPSTSTSTSSNTATANFANMNASNLLNNLSLAAAAAASSGSTNKQQQTASSLLANTYANAFNATGKSNSSNFANSFANLGFNNNMLSGFPSMKMFLDAAAAAAAAVSKGNSSTSTTSTSTVTCATPASNTTTTTPSLSSFANLFGMSNPLFNFSNFTNLANLNQSANKKDGPGSVDFTSLANSLASASVAANLNVGSNEDKTKSSSKNNFSSTTNTKGKNPLSSAAAASMLGSSGLSSSTLPFLYSNPNFAMSSLYNPLHFGLTAPFLNNPNLMNGLANFSNVFTSTTSTPTSSSNLSPKTKLSSSLMNKGNSKVSPLKSPNTATSTPSGLSLASGLLASSAGVHPTSAAAAAALDSDDESLKSLMGNDDEEDLNGDFEGETPEKDLSKNTGKRNKSNKQSSTISKDVKTNKKSAATSK